MKKLQFKPAIHPESVSELKKGYTFHRAQGTVLEGILNDYWWEPLAARLPQSVHPNSLTLLGFLASLAAYLLTFASSNGYDAPMSRSISFTVAFLLFLYQSLDAVDGKQARNLKLSSPLGQLFDHGCDSMTVFFHAFIITATVGIGSSGWTIYSVTALNAQLFLYSWWEHTYGVFRCNTGGYFGVTEGQCVVMVINLFPIIWPAFYTPTLQDLVPAFMKSIVPLWNFNIVSFIIVVSVLYGMLAKDFATIIFHSRPPNCMRAVYDWLYFGANLAANASFILSPAYARSPFLVSFAIACNGSLVAWRIIVASLTRQPFKRSHSPSLPFFCGGVLWHLLPVSSPLSLLIFDLLLAIWSFSGLLVFVIVHLRFLKEQLGVRFFHVGKND